MPDLLPCPFCGGPASREETVKPQSVPLYETGCNNAGCRALPSSGYHFSQEAADEAWNTRSNADRIAALEAELREARMQALASAGQAQDHMEKVVALEAENERLRGALKPFVEVVGQDFATARGAWKYIEREPVHDCFDYCDFEAARAALQENDQ